MNVLDTDGDGQIGLNEFKSFILRANINSTGEISSEYEVRLILYNAWYFEMAK